MKQTIRKLLRRAGYRIEGTRYTPRQYFEPARMRRVEFDDVVCRLMFERGQALSFVQVGAFDGITKDPLHKYITRCGWRGVMVEPQPGPAEALRRLYGDNPNIRIVQAVVDSARGSRSLYTVESDRVPLWAKGMASFERQHILNHEYLIPGIAAYVREIEVPCVTWSDVLAEVPGGSPDLLQTDVEGADAYLLSLFPFEQVKPAVVHFELKVLSRSEKEGAFDLLNRHGYLVAPSGEEDALATLRA